MRANERVCFVSGAGHSGSTLLGLVLGSHPRVFYAGEARKSLFFGNERKALRKRMCKVCGEACPVWGDLGRAPDEDLYEALSRRTGRRIVVDSTKSIDWIDTQIDALRAAGAGLHMVFLGRDGRAVVGSGVRKYPETTAREHALTWVSQIEATEALASRFPGPVTRVRYEELATRPKETIEKLTSALGIDFVPAMLEPWTSEQHPLGGNAGTQSLLEGAQTRIGGALPISGEKRGYYQQHPRGFVLDRRWEHELAPSALAEFEAVAHQTNVPYAWNEPVPSESENA
jgi:hypothetical protein